MKYILLFSTLFTLNALAKDCTLSTYKKLYYVPNGKVTQLSKIIKKSDCPQVIQKTFADAIFSSSGTMTSRSLNSITNANTKVNLIPARVKIINLAEELGRNFKLDKGWSFNRLKFVNKRSFLGLNENESLEFECQFCHTTGEKTIGLQVINPIKNTQKNHWIQGMVFIRATVLIPQRPISPAESGLSPNLFVKKEIEVVRPEKYFTNVEQLVFYKVNKPLTGERGLMFSDLTPVSLVSAGIPSKVILRNGSLVLQGKGIPSQNGRYGEMIKLRNPKTNRIITGKVIDFNKVVVDL